MKRIVDLKDEKEKTTKLQTYSTKGRIPKPRTYSTKKVKKTAIIKRIKSNHPTIEEYYDNKSKQEKGYSPKPEIVINKLLDSTYDDY